ncbi:MAG: glycosyltransferase [Acidimicrobiales bacterium]
MASPDRSGPTGRGSSTRTRPAPHRGDRLGVVECSIVVPTLGRASLGALLRSLREAHPDPRIAWHRVVLVDDRPPVEVGSRSPAHPPPSTTELGGVARAWLGPCVSEVVTTESGGIGPAGARNRGIAATATPWVITLDDDVTVTRVWWRDLADDLCDADPSVGAVFGRICVPLPDDRPATDWERHTARLATARWITADAALRRCALEAVGGFDEGFPRAYREDSDLALRLLDQGWRLETGRRVSVHPPRRAPLLASVAVERGNADDERMRAKHGADFRERLGEDADALPVVHAITTMAAVAAVGAGLARRRRLAAIATTVWAALTARFAARRIAPGPRDAREVSAMVLSSVAIPPAATTHRARGRWRTRREASERSAPAAPHR